MQSRVLFFSFTPQNGYNFNIPHTAIFWAKISAGLGIDETRSTKICQKQVGNSSEIYDFRLIQWHIVSWRFQMNVMKS